MVLAPVTVDVGVYYVIDASSAGTYDLVGSVKGLKYAPTRSSIVSKLNEVYEAQAGITFQLNPANDARTGGMPSKPIGYPIRLSQRRQAPNR